jgi:cytidylate kinase
MTNNRARPDRFVVVAIDGGAASGKSSTSRLLAEQCHLLHVDTGSHYRAVAHACLEAGVAPEDTGRLRAFLDQLQPHSRVVDRQSLICFGNADPPAPQRLRSGPVNRAVSQFAALPEVRDAVKAYQREQVLLARQHGFNGIVMDGRDIGTVILPDADLKVFLVADPATRQARRNLDGGADTVTDRDRLDSSRTTAPLKPARDAVVIDNSRMTLAEVVERLRQLLGR